jgi:signal transduction histidine kinase
MEVAQGPVENASARRTDRFAGAVGRLPLPLGAKLLLGFFFVGTLLAVGYALGLVALNQSNSRGEQLLRLQRRAVYYQLLLTDAKQLQATIAYRINSPGSTKRFGSGLDQAITNQFNQLCLDAAAGGCLHTSNLSQVPFALTRVLPESLVQAVIDELPSFYAIAGETATRSPPLGPGVPQILGDADHFATFFSKKVAALAQNGRVRANALVAADHSSFANSRNLLIGVGAGSLALALALGLLLSWSVVVPPRRTEGRLDEIAAGDFAGRLEVPNRDEIGSLAAKVNRMNDELQRVYRELETASRHKSDFLATMSHELRTPLNAIIGFSEVLHEQMFGQLNERQLAYVDDVLEAGRHLLSLINDVLDLAKIEAGRMDLELSRVAISDLLHSAISMHAERASRGGVELALTTEPEEITITADERRVRQIVFNLLSNAVKFTPTDGRVDVSAHLNHSHVEVAVADTGPGIAPDEIESIFEEFEQTADGKQAEGTGLGLPLSRKLVELHGGRLWVESEPGQGSTFRFTLPVRQETTT